MTLRVMIFGFRQARLLPKGSLQVGRCFATRLGSGVGARIDMTGWSTFADLCKEAFGECRFQDRLVRECGDNPDIAWAAFYHLGDDSLPWLHRQVPSLGGARPIDLIASGDSDSVRNCLWGFPC